MNATPRAVEIAAEMGVDLSAITGTGKAGRITVADVRAAEPPMTVLAATERDLATLGPLAASALAASALALARELDADNSATSKSMVARSLLDVLDRLREQADDQHGKERDDLDDLSARRAARLAAG